MAQEQKRKPAPQESEETAAPTCPKQAEKDKLDKKTEELVDAIDEILEENCEEFVKEYVQRGGQ
jgi:ubiquitin-like protein Pup